MPSTVKPSQFHIPRRPEADIYEDRYILITDLSEARAKTGISARKHRRLHPRLNHVHRHLCVCVCIKYIPHCFTWEREREQARERGEREWARETEREREGGRQRERERESDRGPWQDAWRSSTVRERARERASERGPWQDASRSSTRAQISPTQRRWPAPAPWAYISYTAHIVYRISQHEHICDILYIPIYMYVYSYVYDILHRLMLRYTIYDMCAVFDMYAQGAGYT